MDGNNDIGPAGQVGNTVISSLLNTAGGISGIKQALQQTRFESQMRRLLLAESDLNEADLLARMLGVEPLISEQEYAS
jgi:hypothetical protein